MRRGSERMDQGKVARRGIAGDIGISVSIRGDASASAGVREPDSAETYGILELWIDHQWPALIIDTHAEADIAMARDHKAAPDFSYLAVYTLVDVRLAMPDFAACGSEDKVAALVHSNPGRAGEREPDRRGSVPAATIQSYSIRRCFP